MSSENTLVLPQAALDRRAYFGKCSAYAIVTLFARPFGFPRGAMVQRLLLRRPGARRLFRAKLLPRPRSLGSKGPPLNDRDMPRLSVDIDITYLPIQP